MSTRNRSWGNVRLYMQNSYPTRISRSTSPPAMLDLRSLATFQPVAPIAPDTYLCDAKYGTRLQGEGCAFATGLLPPYSQTPVTFNVNRPGEPNSLPLIKTQRSSFPARSNSQKGEFSQKIAQQSVVSSQSKWPVRTAQQRSPRRQQSYLEWLAGSFGSVYSVKTALAAS